MSLLRAPASWRAVGAGAVALLVVGAGASIGMASSQGGHRHPLGGAAAPGPGSQPTATTPGSASTAPGLTTTTTSTSATTRAAGPTGAAVGAAGSGPAGGPGPTVGSTAPSPPAATSPGGGSGMPQPGTYSYATSGSQTLLSNTSSYPPTTTIDVTRQGCGVSSKWNSSSGDSTTVVECPVPGGIHIVSETSTVDSGGYHYTQTFNCAADSFVPTSSGTPGQTWHWACTASNGETADEVVKLIGPAEMTVGGTAVRTEHVQVVATLSGSEKGTATTDYWVTADSTAVREVGSIDASEFGVTYTARYTLQLDSLTPAR